MFDEKQLDEFINKMFDNSVNDINNTVKESLTNFKTYLEETEMCTPEYLKKLDKIIDCSDEFLSLKLKLGNIDITSFVETEKKTPAPHKPGPNRIKQKKLGEMPTPSPNNNHRSHYVNDDSSSYSSGCANRTRSNALKETYSSGCGCSSTTYRSC